MMQESQSKWWPFALRVVVVLGVAFAFAVPLFVWRDELLLAFSDREHVAAEIRNAGAWGPAVIVALAIAQTVVAPIPGQMINFVAGYVYGPGLGLFYSWIGLVSGAAIAMLLARYAGRPIVERLVSPAHLQRMDRLAANKGLPFFILFFLIPGLPDDLLCFIVGFTKLPLRIMLPIAALARIPGLVGAVWLGASAERIPAAVWFAISILGLVVVVLFWRYGERIQKFLLRTLGSHEQHG